MFDREVRENGKVYRVDQYGNKRVTTIGEDFFEMMPAAMALTNTLMKGSAKVVQGLAKKHLSEEEYAQLEENQAKTPESLMSKIGLKDWGGAAEAEAQGNKALGALGKHYFNKAVNLSKKMIDKDKE